ncbi:MAG: tetratricopeptide repeat protein [Candidatus Latescibacterota bacterium]|nr:MAG: tetratricopeptide repeat protein [Candidatus Latescibacterota bacterium]
MESYDLRSEIIAKGQKYYIQTNLVPSQKTIVTSVFHEGSLLSKQVEDFDASLSPDAARFLVREYHEEKKTRINSLLGIKEKLEKSEDPKAHLKLGEALYHQSLYREAMSEVVRAVKLGIEESKAFSILGNSLVAVGEYEKAIKSFRKGIQITPDYPDLHNYLGCGYLCLKRCRDAVRAFEQAIDLNKYYHTAYLNLAIALCLNVVEKQEFELSRGLRERIRDILNKCLQLKPSLDTEEFQNALRAVESERYDVVYETLNTIKQDSEKISKNHLSLDLYLILKFGADSISEEEIDRYIERAVRALEANPGYADLQNDLGVLYTAKCKLYIDKARDSFHKSLKINKGFKRAEKNLKLTVNDGQGIHLLLKALLD